MLKLFSTILIFFVSALISLHGQNEEIYYKFEGDSITKKEFELSEVTVYNEINFKDSDERIKYLILRRKTLKVYPYAALAAERLKKLNDRLGKLNKRSKRKKYTRIVEKYIQEEFTSNYSYNIVGGIFSQTYLFKFTKIFFFNNNAHSLLE